MTELEPDAPTPFGSAPSAVRELTSSEAKHDLLWCVSAHVVASGAVFGLSTLLAEPLRVPQLVALIAVSHGTLLLAVLVLVARRGRSLADLGAARPTRGWTRLFALLIPTQLLMWATLAPIAAVLYVLDLVPERAPIQAVEDLPWFVALGTALTAGFVEELLFRGLILDRLVRVFGAARKPRPAFLLAAGVSSVWFGIGHAANGIGAAIMTAAIGFFLCVVVRRSRGNLVLAMLVHTLQDAVALLLL
ncbi:MAG: CPBP family intramembrane metalloprotease [Planctomycetes bacterium]|nr:CPBP family intramembrane metalloprotease [Planctomycetota bacterium]